MFEVAQAAMDQLGGRRRRSTGEIVLFTKENLETASRSIPRDAAPVYTPANDGEVEGGVHSLSPIARDLIIDDVKTKIFGLQASKTNTRVNDV